MLKLALLFSNAYLWFIVAVRRGVEYGSGLGGVVNDDVARW